MAIVPPVAQVVAVMGAATVVMSMSAPPSIESVSSVSVSGSTDVFWTSTE